MTSYKEAGMDQFSKELLLLLCLLKSECSDSILKKNKEMIRDIDWDLFIELTLHHRVFSIIYKRLKEIDKDNVLFPNQVMQTLRQKYENNVFRMLQLCGETEIIVQLFDKKEIRTLFLKGPVLAAHLYGDISLRTSADLDILIPIDKLCYAEEILLTQGYIKNDYIKSVLNDWKWRHHHITFFHPIKKIKVEIHWRLNPGPAKEPSFNHLWDRKRKSLLSGNSTYMLGNEDLFLFLVTHGSRHGWSRLRWLLDIEKLMRLDLNWNKVKTLLKQYHYLQVGGQAIKLTSIIFNTKIPQEMKQLTNSKRPVNLANGALFYLKQMVNLHTEPIPQEIADYHKKHLFKLMSLPQKFLFVGSFLFPYPEDAEVLPLPNYLHFLYFPLRPFLWVWRWRKKHALS